jgi:hypothetical protein
MKDVWETSTEYSFARLLWEERMLGIRGVKNEGDDEIPFELSQEFRDGRLAFKRRFGRTKADH